MHPPIHALHGFYEGPKGQVVRRVILRRLRRIWPNLKGRRLLGLGYGLPYLRSFVADAERVLAAMPAEQGAEAWAPAERNLTTLVNENALPFSDFSFDCALLVHALEMSEAQRAFMREVWRILSADGQLLVIVPNRTSLWAQLETSPFGQGRPYSRGQLQALLEQSLFQIENWDEALFMPPFGGWRIRTGEAWDRVGRRLWPRFAGVHIVAARKSLYAPATLAPVKAGRHWVPA